MDWKEKKAEIITKIYEGKIKPNCSIETFVCMNGENMLLQLEDKSVEGALIFFWNYENACPMHVREYDVNNGLIEIDDFAGVIAQLKIAQMYSMRMCILVKQGDEFKCGYLKNSAIDKKYSGEVPRYIGRMASNKERSFIAYYTQEGVVCVKFIDSKKFVSNYYRAHIVGYKFIENGISCYIEMPAYTDKAECYFADDNNNKVMSNKHLVLDYKGTNGVKNVYCLNIDFSLMECVLSGMYSAFIEIDHHRFGLYVRANVTFKDEVYTFNNKNGEPSEYIFSKSPINKFQFKTDKKIYPVMLSIVTAVYNTAPFLSEMINSVLNQDIDALYEKYVEKEKKYQDIFELVLVDDGATDGSAQILDEYARLSKRVRVIHKENGGVSSARNMGISVARGKYLNFADSDDKLSSNYMQEVLSFFESNEDKVSVVAVPLKYIDGRSGNHWANYKFTENNRIVDLNKEPNANLYTVNASCVKSESIHNLFNESLKIGEDMAFINDIILAEGLNLGMVGKAAYYYRVRTSGEESAMDSIKNNDASYIPVVQDVFLNYILKSIDKCGYVPKYVQHTVMGQLQWRFAATDKGESIVETIGEKGFEKYKSIAYSILQYIDDDVILAQKQIWAEHKYYLLKQKYGKKPDFIRENNDCFAKFGTSKIGTTVGNCYLKFEFLSIENNRLQMEGFAMNFEDDMKLNIYINGNKVDYATVDRDANKYTFDEVCYYAKTFVIDYPLDSNVDKYEISFTTEFGDIEVKKKQLRYSKMVPLSESYKKSYCQVDNWTVRCEDTNLVVYNNDSETAELIDFEGEFENEIKLKKKGNVERILRLRKIALARLGRRSSNKKIWLISDREHVAGDNGEALFKYLNKINDESVEAYFVINGDADDYERMSQYGRVIVRGSDKHIVTHLMADYLVSSSGDEWIINPVFQNKHETECVKDLLKRSKFIFLQHGITVSDQTAWLNRYNKDIEGIICVTKQEAASFVEYDYHYTEKNAWLTGMPRYDYLHDEQKKVITIMPTWRKWLTESKFSTKLGKNFLNSEYYAFYDGLLNDKRLLDEADKYGYKICYMPHPTVRPSLDLFHKNDRVEFYDEHKSYTEVYAESSLIMTDYSSSVMDFALLRKPVVYCQFDEEMFWKNHTYSKGFFEWDRDGFGEVTYSKDELIDLLVDYMKKGCKLKPKYAKRADEFFVYSDHDNCKRVYEKIKALGNN